MARKVVRRVPAPQLDAGTTTGHRTRLIASEESLPQTEAQVILESVNCSAAGYLFTPENGGGIVVVPASDVETPARDASAHLGEIDLHLEQIRQRH